jgi:exosortase/archaeosortase family protein
MMAGSALKIRLLRVTGFGLLVLLLQAGLQQWRAQPVGQAWIDRVTVTPVATALGMMRPADQVRAQGERLIWPGGRLRLQAGCDGLEVLVLLVAATMVAPLGWRRGLVTLLGGTLLVWLLNQARLLALYGSFRFARESFDLLHTLVAPMLVLLPALGWLAWNLHREARRPWDD